MTAPTVAPPVDPSTWEDYLNTVCDSPQALQKALEDTSDKGFKAKINAYLKADNKVMTDLRSQVEEQAQLAVHAMLENFELPKAAKVDIAENARRQRYAKDGQYYSTEARGHALDGEFTNVADFAQHAIAYLRQEPSAIKRFTEMKNYSEVIPSEGGVLVPEEMRSDILTRSLETALVRPRAVVVPMPSGKLRYPAVDFTTEVGEFYGGITGAWVDAGETIPASSGSFASILLDANKLALRATTPNELLRHAPAFLAWLNSALPAACGGFEDIALIKGNGVGRPLGQLHPNNPSLITVSKELGQSAGITWPNVLSMVSRMLPENLLRADWVIDMSALPEIMTMALPVGTGGSAVMAVNAAVSGPQTLFGRPITWSRRTPGVLGTQGDISLTDFSTYLIGDTMAMRLEASSHELFSSDQTVFRLVEELDGRPQFLSSLAPENGGPTLSATVQLETR